MIKKLIFEGCGLKGTDADSDIFNDRLRTAFHDDEGKAIFIEIAGHALTKFSDKSLAVYGDVVGFVDCSYYINMEKPINDLWRDDIVKNGDKRQFFEWTKENLIKLLKSLNTTVEKIEIDNSGAYQVFREDEIVYNFGDEGEIKNVESK